MIGEVSDDWRKENFTHTFKKGKKEDPGKYRPMGLTSSPRTVMEQIFLEAISQRTEKKRLCTRQLGLTKVKLRLINLIAYDEMIASVDEGRAADVIYVVKSCIWDVIAHAPVQAGGQLARTQLCRKDLVDK